ncbi:MAG TPA: hypothetical protein DEB66_15570 [Micrococcaceae bacterium]|nr:hypothetical protein [Micrococcaceae bacterium]
MEPLIALGILVCLLAATAILLGWVALVDRLADRFNWPFWLNVCLAFAPFAVGIYFSILLKLN